MLARLILLIAFLIVAVTVIQTFRKTPKSQTRALYWKLGLSAAAIVLILLAVTGRIPLIGAAIGAVLPFLRRLLPLLVRYFPLLQQMRHQHTQSSTTGGGRSRAHTSILKMTRDHDSNRLYGEVISGPYAGRQLDTLELVQLRELLDYCQGRDRNSTQLLLTYLNQRFGSSWQQHGATAGANGPLDESAAYAILGLQKGASRQQIIDAHRRLMQRMHPDRGGSDYLAAQINQAKDLLLKKVA